MPITDEAQICLNALFYSYRSSIIVLYFSFKVLHILQAYLMYKIIIIGGEQRNEDQVVRNRCALCNAI